MKIHPLHPHAALLLENIDKKYIVVSDLHIGLETKLASKGITIKSDVATEMINEINSLIALQHPDGIILLGDVKHSISNISRQEWDNVPAFLKEISSKAEVYLVPGNHDGNIRHLVPSNINILSSKGMVFADTLLIHGHSLPSNIRSYVNRIVMGHIHPVFLKRGSIINGERVWVYLQTKKQMLFLQRGILDIIVMPSFNPYLYAADERIYSHKAISPIITRIMQNEVDIKKCIVTMLDGSIVGDIEDLHNIL